MKATFFLKKGKHPHIRPSRKSRDQGRKSRDQGRKSRDQGRKSIGTFIFHWKLFPLRAIVRIKYQSKNNNINLCLINILYE